MPSADLPNISSSFSSFTNIVAGEARSASSTHQAVDPSNRQSLWPVPVATEQDLNDAVAASRKAFPAWSKMKWEERAKLLLKAKDVLAGVRTEMAQLLLHETGKPDALAQAEVEHSMAFLEFYANQPPPTARVMQDDENLKITVRYVPLGVVGAICPWNFPLVLGMGKITAALITGNTIIVKPSPFSPYSILKFIELVQPIFPPGVLQGINGDDKLGPQICQHPNVDKISFTGSIATGKKVMQAASSTLKRVTLELGGNSASIVLPDVDVQAVAPQVALGSFFNSGQLCAASKRLFVHKDIYDEFLAALTATVKSWKTGPAGIPGTMLGPVQNEMQYNVVKKIFDDTVSKGYKFALGGELPDNDKDFVIQPAIIDSPPDDSVIVKEEPFGPIVPVLSWTDEDDVIRRANDTLTGLGGAVWSSNIEKAEELASRIEAGTVWINSYEKPLPNSYFSGHKQSGIGGEWGEQGLLSYCNAQAIQYWKAPVGKVASKDVPLRTV